MQDVLGRLVRLRNHLRSLADYFPDREFHYRARGRIRYFVLSGRAQLWLCSIFALAVSWSVFATFYVVNFDGVLREKNIELAQVKSGERQLLREVAAFNARFRDLTETIARNRTELMKMAGREASGPGGESAAGANSAATNVSNEAIKSQMRALTESWQELNAKSSRLESELAALGREMEGTLNEQGRLKRERDAQQAQIKELRDQLAGVRSANERLMTDIEQGKYFKKERDQFGARIRSLEGELNTLRGTNLRLKEQVEEGGAMRRERNALADRVRTLEDELTAMRSSQERLVENLFDRSKKGVSDLERVVAMTGLDIDRMVGAHRADARGGPVVEAKFTDDETLNARVTELRRRIERWQTLKIAVKNLPLITPLESFRMTSGFGGRRDPFTGNWSAHNGLDLQNAVGTPVLATGPGTVVLAGWQGGYGWMVEVDHGMGVRTRYAHLQSIAVEKGQKVDGRDKVGLLGCSGRCSGAHLHYEILIDGKAVDPSNFLSAGRYVQQR
jgi:murein DD-endopeptidase MepM/ murein hydrolase activator NlpD